MLLAHNRRGKVDKYLPTSRFLRRFQEIDSRMKIVVDSWRSLTDNDIKPQSRGGTRGEPMDNLTDKARELAARRMERLASRHGLNRRMSIRLSSDLAEALDRCADEDSRSPADWARLAIERATQARAIHGCGHQHTSSGYPCRYDECDNEVCIDAAIAAHEVRSEEQAERTPKP